MTRIKILYIGSYDKWFCIKSWQKFTNLLLLCKVSSKKWLSERCRKLSRVKIGYVFHKVSFFCLTKLHSVQIIAHIRFSLQFPPMIYFSHLTHCKKKGIFWSYRVSLEGSIHLPATSSGPFGVHLWNHTVVYITEEQRPWSLCGLTVLHS